MPVVSAGKEERKRVLRHIAGGMVIETGDEDVEVAIVNGSWMQPKRRRFTARQHHGTDV